MKKQVTCLLALVCHVLIVHAQFNKSFYHTIAGLSEAVAPTDIVDGGNNTTVTIAHSFSGNYIVLRRLDFNGNVVLEVAHEMTDLIPTRIIRTLNDEFIAVGHVGRTDKMFATRFDNTFNVLWSTELVDASGYHVNFYTNFREVVNIVKVDNSYDDYIVVGTGGINLNWDPVYGPVPPPTASPNPNHPMGAYAFTAISAVRIAGGNGTSIWNRKYFSPLAPYAYDPPAAGLMFLRREGPSALAYGAGKYFIGGVALSRYFTSGNPSGPYDDKFTNFMMTIDDNGGIVDAYREFIIPPNLGNPFNKKSPGSYSLHDAIYDGQTQQFIMSFSINDFLLGNGINETEIGIAKFNSNLGYANLRYYFDPTNVHHFAYRIKETYAGDAYIVTCGVNRFLTIRNSFNPALLKLAKNGGVQFYHRYNQNQFFHQNQFFLANPATTPVMDGNGVENYAIACSPMTNSRVISTDINGEACGYRPYSPGYIEVDFSPSGPVNYYSADDIYQNSRALNPLPLMVVDYSDCDYVNPDAYKTAGITTIEMNTARVYPTVLEAGNNTVQIETNADATTDIMISVLSIDGRIVSSKHMTINKGSMTTSYELPVSAPGIYMLKLTSNTNDLNKTIRIYKQ